MLFNIGKCKVLYFGADNAKIDYAMNHDETHVYFDNCSSE